MFDRRGFLGAGSALFAVAGIAKTAGAAVGEGKKEVMQGFNETDAGKLSSVEWKPFSDRKVRVGIAGEGVCNFGSSFAYQERINADRKSTRCKAARAPSQCYEFASRFDMGGVSAATLLAESDMPRR